MIFEFLKMSSKICIVSWKSQWFLRSIHLLNKASFSDAKYTIKFQTSDNDSTTITTKRLKYIARVKSTKISLRLYRFKNSRLSSWYINTIFFLYLKRSRTIWWTRLCFWKRLYVLVFFFHFKNFAKNDQNFRNNF